ncbi:MAG: glycosyltransferase family 4 protein, partial [Flavobacteriales bacterium]
IDLILAAAKALPDIPFTIVGASSPSSYGRPPANLRVLGRTGQAELRELFHAHSIYLQPSVMEGFPNALCEAMLCGCLPVVSDMTSMPEIAGDCGAVLSRRDHGALIEAIRRLHALAPEEAGPRRLAARSRILPFTLERRIARLQQVLGH